MRKFKKSKKNLICQSNEKKNYEKKSKKNDRCLKKEKKTKRK